MATPRSEDGELTFLGGMDSMSDPAMLTPGFYARALNAVNRGGVLQCRPGYRCRFAMPAGNLQGGFVFRPKVGIESVLFAVDGLVYLSDYPYRTFRQLAIQFSPTARQLFFVQAEQATTRNDDGSIRIIPAINLVIIQDGGLTAPAVFDGYNAFHNPEIKLGGPMAWSGDRLWVAQGAKLFASDLYDPQHFLEPQYFATVEAFTLPGEITALAEPTANAELASLFVFTQDTTTLIQSGIRDRATWLATPNFQFLQFPEVGCVSARSVSLLHGLLWWYSAGGLTNVNAAELTRQTSVTPYEDNEMADSKSRLGDDLNGIACGFFENYLLVSVPYCDKKNTHTWCLDGATWQKKDQKSPFAWNSMWSGTRPVEWLYGLFAGSNRIFFVSADFDGQNRLWEAFTPDRLDDGCPITWYGETRAFSAEVPLRDKTVRYADIFMSELSGTVDIAVFWAGPYRGRYKRLMTKRIEAPRGSIRQGHKIKSSEKMFAFKKQTRPLRTQDAKELASAEDLSSCDVESFKLDFLDESFQLLIVVSGPGAVRGIRIYMEPAPGTPGAVSPNKELSGRCEEDEGPEQNFVRFDGAASDSIAELNANIPLFTSNQTVSITEQGLTEVGTGYGESIISQQDADKIAQAIARRRASRQLELSLPIMISTGTGL
jgi:hypothetical protein